MITQAEKESKFAQRLLDDYDEVSNDVSIASSNNDHRLPRTSLERNRNKLSYGVRFALASFAATIYTLCVVLITWHAMSGGIGGLRVLSMLGQAYRSMTC